MLSNSINLNAYRKINKFIFTHAHDFSYYSKSEVLTVRFCVHRIMEQFLGKKYILHSSDDVKKVVEDVGFDVAPTEIGKPVPVVLELRKVDDTYALITTSPKKTIVMDFQNFSSYKETTSTGVLIKRSVKIIGSVLHNLLEFSNGNTVFIDYLFSDDAVRVLIESDEATATQFYKRLN